jgi:hypothetical protein
LLLYDELVPEFYGLLTGRHVGVANTDAVADGVAHAAHAGAVASADTVADRGHRLRARRILEDHLERPS